MNNKIKFIAQRDNMDCGPACLAMISLFYKKKYSLEYLKSISHITKEGVSFLGLKEVTEKIGFNSIFAKLTVNQLVTKSTHFPCILHWNQTHFVVLYKVRNHFFYIADPEFGLIKFSKDKFERSWLYDENKGAVLFLFPTNRFYEQESTEESKLSVKNLFNYLKPYK